MIDSNIQENSSYFIFTIDLGFGKSEAVPVVLTEASDFDEDDIIEAAKFHGIIEDHEYVEEIEHVTKEEFDEFMLSLNSYQENISI